MEEQVFHIINGPDKHSWITSLSAGDTMHGQRYSVYLVLAERNALWLHLMALERADSTHLEGKLYKANDVWHFRAYVTDNDWKHCPLIEGKYSTDRRKGYFTLAVQDDKMPRRA